MAIEKQPLGYKGQDYDASDFKMNGRILELKESTIQYKEVSVTSAEVKGLAAAQHELVAAPGAGKCLEFVSALFKLDYGGTNAFTETDDDLVIKYTDASGAAASAVVENTGFIDQTADTYYLAQPAAAAAIAATGIENQALVLDNDGNGEIAGNAAGDNLLIVGIAYRVHTL